MRVDGPLTANKRVLDALDLAKAGICLDQWGTCYDPDEGHEPGFRYRQNSIRNALGR
jgi:alpha-N-arabinofuranosidase